MATFRAITLLSRTGPGRVDGELVVVTELAWQVAVAGQVVIFQKSDYIEKPPYRGDFANFFNGWVR